MIQFQVLTADDTCEDNTRRKLYDVPSDDAFDSILAEAWQTYVDWGMGTYFQVWRDGNLVTTWFNDGSVTM